MRNLILILSIFTSVSFVENGYTYRNIHYGDYLAVTYDNNHGELDWDNSNSNLAFVTNTLENREIFYLNLNKLSISSGGEGFYSADYLNELTDKSNVYQPLFTAYDTSFFAPRWNSKGDKIMAIGKSKNENEIFITNKKSKILMGTKIKNVKAAHWKNDSTIYVVYENDLNKLNEIVLGEKKEKMVLETNQPIKGISKHSNSIFLISENGISEFSVKKQTVKWFKLPIKGNTGWRISKLNFVALNKNGNAQILDVNNATTHPFCYGDNNGPPALSHNKKFVAFYSEFFNGIIIKRIDKKFLME
ncbi:MAG: hypothetical protein CMP67_11180 [Flavobacteriales bacterium]|nr:hypothetical protein [Flavobacteriales bacterium]|tara:strand:- start:1638 stop:2546 length:909 start_codon:yes stop_codon:yes gene_type:complete